MNFICNKYRCGISEGLELYIKGVNTILEKIVYESQISKIYRNCN
ncbi:MAG: hypothetical protein RXQ68_00150 [Candidatus Nanopusillus sp.]